MLLSMPQAKQRPIHRRTRTRTNYYLLFIFIIMSKYFWARVNQQFRLQSVEATFRYFFFPPYILSIKTKTKTNYRYRHRLSTFPERKKKEKEKQSNGENSTSSLSLLFFSRFQQIHLLSLISIQFILCLRRRALSPPSLF